MIHITLTRQEIKDFGKRHPNVPSQCWAGLALAKKGIRFKPTFGPLQEEHMIPPWKVWEDPSDGTIHVWQGETK